MQRGSSTMVLYRDVALLSVFNSDVGALTRFVERELGELAHGESYVADLRRTVQVFLKTRSPLATANELYLVRNTINYRLRRAEDLDGHALSERSLPLWIALVLAEDLLRRRTTGA